MIGRSVFAHHNGWGSKDGHIDQQWPLHIGFSTQKQKTDNLHNTRKNKQPNNCNHIFWLNVNNLLRWYCSYEKTTISSNIGIDHLQWHHWDPLRTSLHDHVSHACQVSTNCFGHTIWFQWCRWQLAISMETALFLSVFLGANNPFYGHSYPCMQDFKRDGKLLMSWSPGRWAMLVVLPLVNIQHTLW